MKDRKYFIPLYHRKNSYMGNLKRHIKKTRSNKKNSVDVTKIAGTLSEKEKEVLLDGSGFVKVPTEELKRLRVDVYSYLL